MAATSTLKQILEQLVAETGMGYVLPAYTATTTAITMATSYGAGPFTGSKFPIGSPIVVTSTTGLGERTFVSAYNPTTGVITVSPAITTGSTSAVMFDKEFEHADRITEAINRAVNNRVVRWTPTPLTYVPDGDMRGATVTDYWTAAANGTAAYASAQVYPAGSAAGAVGQTNLSRVVQLTTSGGSSSVDGNGIRVPLTTQLRQWYFQTSIRLVSGSGTATFSIRDNTNSATITPTVTRGNDSMTMTTTNLGDFIILEGTFQVPATCAEIAPRLALSATGLVAQMGPVIMFPVAAKSFPLPNRVISEAYVGNFHYGYLTESPAGYGQLEFSEPITTGGLTHTLNNFGDHYTVTFSFSPYLSYTASGFRTVNAIWFDELIGDSELTAITTTTTFPIDHVVKWAKYELFKYLYQKERARGMRLPTGQPSQSIWRVAAIEAKIEAENSDYEPRLMQIYGRT